MESKPDGCACDGASLSGCGRKKGTYDTAGQEENGSQTVEDEHYVFLEKCGKSTGQARQSSH